MQNRTTFLLFILLLVGVGVIGYLRGLERGPGIGDVDTDVATLQAVLPEAEGYKLQKVPCWFDISWRQSVACARLHTPAETGRYSLPVVVIRASKPRDPVPLLYISGGPGDPAHIQADDIPYWQAWYERADLQRDLVLVDRRGTGLSVPRHKCDAYTQFSRQVLAQDVSLEEELRRGRAVVRECLQSLDREGFDRSHLGTRQSARDLQALMLSLGYHHWHLFGVSYGTRLGLELLALSPDRVQSAVLDSVYPRGKGRLTEWPWLLNLSLEKLFNYCPQGGLTGGGQARQAKSASVGGALTECPLATTVQEQKFWRALATLKQTPLQLTVKSWHGEPPFRVVINDHRFVSAVFDALYDRTQIAKIAAAVDAALARDSQGLLPLIEPFVNYAFDPQFSSMVFMAVECGENPDVSEQAYLQQVEQYPGLEPYTRDLWRYDVCRDWTRDMAQVASAAATNPVAEGYGEVPALLLAGGLDPITPSLWARELNKRWPGSQVLLIPEAGHSVVGNVDCVHGLLGAYYRNPRQTMGSEVLQESCPQP